MTRLIKDANSEEKIWGRTRTLFESPHCSLHSLDIIARRYCSLHYHCHRANKFEIVSGYIIVAKFMGPIINLAHLRAGDSFIVESLVPHMFLSVEDSCMLEEYFPDRGGTIDVNDIVRIVEGGVISPDTDVTDVPYALLQDLSHQVISD